VCSLGTAAAKMSRAGRGERGFLSMERLDFPPARAIALDARGRLLAYPVEVGAQFWRPPQFSDARIQGRQRGVRVRRMDHAVALPAQQLGVFARAALLARQAVVLRQLFTFEQPATDG